MSGVRKPADYECMFQYLSCKKRAERRVVQLGEDVRETLTSAECRRLASWLHRAARWIDAKAKQEGGR